MPIQFKNKVRNRTMHIQEQASIAIDFEGLIITWREIHACLNHNNLYITDTIDNCIVSAELHKSKSGEIIFVMLAHTKKIPTSESPDDFTLLTTHDCKILELKK